MRNSKLFVLLSSLSMVELRRMRKIFQSPFFTTNERHLVLYDLLRKYHPDFATSKLTKEWIFEKLYPGKPFNDGLLRVLIREFTEMTEEYLLLLALRKEKLERKKMLTNIYNDRNLYAFFEKETQKLLKELNNNDCQNWSDYRDIYELNFAYFFHPSTQKLPDNDAPLFEMMDSLDKQYALAKFRVGSEMMNRAKIYARQYDIRLFEELKAIAATDFAENDTTFELFSLLFQFYEATEPKKVAIFEKLKLIFSQNFKKLIHIDQSLFLTQLINFTVKRINLGESAYYKEGLNLYKMALEADLVLEHGRIDEAVYTNIVSLGCHANEFSWVAQFMSNYNGKLKEDVREDIYELSKGWYFFHQKDYENARHQFMNFGYSGRFQPMARMNLIKTLFEEFLLDNSLFDLLNSQIMSFNKYFQRNFSKNEYRFDGYRNFGAIVKILTYGIFENKNKKKLIAQIESLVEQKPKIMGKGWFREKLKKLR